MKKFYFLTLLLLSIVFLPKTVNADTEKYTREELQDLIVSTALSYYYKNTYTDYEGYWAEDSNSIYSTMYDISPEMLSRSKYMTTQCEAFSSSVYLFSLGYDFWNYRNELENLNRYTSYKTSKGTTIWGGSSIEAFKKLYGYFNKGYSVGLLNKIARNHTTDPIVVATYQKGVLSTIDGFSDYSSSLTEIDNPQGFINKVKELLQPGDIIYNDGHSMLWIGDALEPNGGAIHSSGTSYAVEKGQNGEIESVTSGYDAYSVRYSSADYILNRQVLHHGNRENTILTIMRPIDAVCTFDSEGKCELNSDLAKIDTNAKARVLFKNLRVEQFIYDVTGDRVLSVDTSSVGLGDVVSYRLFLTNESKIQFCSSGTRTAKDDCENSGYCSSLEYTDKNSCTSNGKIWTNYTWNTTSNSKDYSDIRIVATVPKNTTFVSCSNNCKQNGNSVVWDNVSIKGGDSQAQYTYNVKVNDNASIKSITNDGMQVEYNNEILKLDKITTRVNSTINGKYAKAFKELVSSDVDNQNLKSYSSSLEYATDAYERFFAKEDIVISNDSNKLSSLINNDNINSMVEAIFSKNSFDDFYIRKASSDVTSLSGNGKIINEMLVPYFYGGRKYEHLYFESGMDYYYTVKPLWSSQINFNIGDIIITLKANTSESSTTFNVDNALIYTGIVQNSPTYTYYKDSNLIQHRIIENYNNTGTDWYSNKYLLNELYQSDLYFVIRPSMYYNPQFVLLDEKIKKEEVTENPQTGSLNYICICAVLLLASVVLLSNLEKKNVFKKIS